MQEKKIKIFFVSVLAILAGGYILVSFWFRYNPKGAQFHLRYNAERKRLGIMELPTGWTTHDYQDHQQFWFPPDSAQHGNTYHSAKFIRMRGKKILLERDDITHETPDGYVALSIEYNYEHPHHWKYFYNENGKVEVTRHQADSILQAWRFVYKP